MSGQIPPNGHQPDVTSILRTLSAFSKPSSKGPPLAPYQNVSTQQQPQGQIQHQPQPQPQHTGSWIPSPVADDDYDPTALPMLLAGPRETSSLAQPPAPVSFSGNGSVALGKQSSSSSISASLQRRVEHPKSITTWSAALRHITRLLHEDPTAVRRVRELVKTQHTNERQWWQGREELLQKQETRDDGRAQIQEALKSIGLATPVKPSADGKQKAQDDADELTAYDTKVHRLMQRIASEQEKSLAAIGIPFFGLQITDKAAFEASELAALQSKALAFLEDYTKE